ncbi:MAG TPA: sugar ABC transporter permease [Nitrososphaeraceae archaeon]|jgi:multiple sugar transport system permease protein|nr:sugar ABC transporter permease [Nitrososphaeraceae archaeon]HKG72559.1 sugar ABC transporter permease [Nitrososphaeraceae archaeon]
MPSIFEKTEPYLFLTPALAILLIFLIFPLFWNTYISLHDVSLTTILRGWEYIGGTNFINLFNDPNFYSSLKVTLMFVGGSVALQFGIGMLMSVLLHQQVRASGVLRAIFIIPWTISAVIAAFSFKFIFDDNFGILNYLLNEIGLQSVGWLSDPSIVIWSLVIANVWYGTPFTILFLTAGLLSINPTIYEAAVIDGATKIRSFIYITLPLLKPFIVINLILITMWSVNFFDIQLIMTGGGPLFASTTASLYMYRQAFEFGLLSKGASAGIVLIAINLSIAFFYHKLFRR